MDFIKWLLNSEGYTDILVIVNQLTKQSMFILTHNSINSEGLASLFIQYIFSKHGLPSHITSDRGTEFTSKFFKILAIALDMKLYFSAGYHLEANRQTERTNETLEQYLQIYCNYQQSNWVRLLFLAEFTYNNYHDFIKQLSYYLYFFFFSFGLTTQGRSMGKCHMTKPHVTV